MSVSVLWIAVGCAASWALGFLFGKVIRLAENFFNDAI